MDRLDLAVHLLGDAPKQNSKKSASQWHDFVGPAGAFLSSKDSSRISWTSTKLANEQIALAFDHQQLYSDFAAMFGASPAGPALADSAANVVIEVIGQTGVSGYGYLRIVRDQRPVPAMEYFIGYGRTDCPYREVGRFEDWTAFNDQSSVEPIFMIRNEHCFFRLTETWTIIALSLVFRAAFGLRHDAILFHAAAVIVNGEGFMLAGPRYSGKSTLSLALAARGHHFLSDEIAWYVPSTGNLTAFRRPVGVREGIRSAAIDARMEQVGDDGLRWHDSRRLPVETLVPQEAEKTASLDFVVFLKGFEKQPRIVPVHASMEHLPLLQPIPISMLNVSPARRMMEMARLVSSVRMYDLYPGHPDETAKLLEEIAQS